MCVANAGQCNLFIYLNRSVKGKLLSFFNLTLPLVQQPLFLTGLTAQKFLVEAGACIGEVYTSISTNVLFRIPFPCTAHKFCMLFSRTAHKLFQRFPRTCMFHACFQAPSLPHAHFICQVVPNRLRLRYTFPARSQALPLRQVLCQVVPQPVPTPPVHVSRSGSFMHCTSLFPNRFQAHTRFQVHARFQAPSLHVYIAVFSDCYMHVHFIKFCTRHFPNPAFIMCCA